MRTRNSLQRLNRNRDRGTTATFRSSCCGWWLCCTSTSTSPDQRTNTESPRNATTRSASQTQYETSNFASTSFQNNDIKTAPHSPNSSAKNYRKISPTTNHHANNPIQISSHAHKIEIPQLRDDQDTKSNSSHNARKLTAVSETNSDTIEFMDNASGTMSLRSEPVVTAFVALERKTEQRTFQKYSLADNYNAPKSHVTLTSRFAHSTDVTLNFSPLIPTTPNMARESETMHPNINEAPESQRQSVQRKTDPHRLFNPKTAGADALPNAETLHSKIKSGVNVKSWTPPAERAGLRTENSIDTSIDTTNEIMNDECEGGDRGGLLVVGAEFPTWPTYNLEGISDELFGDILNLDFMSDNHPLNSKTAVLSHTTTEASTSASQDAKSSSTKSVKEVTTTTTTKTQKLTAIKTVSSSSSLVSSSQQISPRSPSKDQQPDYTAATVIEENQSKTSSSQQENNQTTTTIMNGPENTSTTVSSSQSLLAAEQSIVLHRKHSLMPTISENELLSGDLGARDPVAVAQVFGEDFASRFCAPFEMLRSPIAPLSLNFDTEKMSRDSSSPNYRRMSTEAAKFSGECPTITVNIDIDSSYYDDPPNTTPETRTGPIGPNRQQIPSKSQKSESAQNINVDYSGTEHDLTPGCAKENPEFLRFQRSFVKWINKHTNCYGSAFVLRSENNLAMCRCGHDLLIQALGLKYVSPECRSGECEIQGPIATDIQDLDNYISSDLYYLAELIYKNSSGSVPDRSEISASLCGIRSACGFITTIIIVHQSKETRQKELNAFLPNMEMIGSLTAVVSNLDEQKKISHLSQTIIDKTQRVLLNMQDMTNLVRNITKEAKALVEAEICSLFLLDRENKELVAEVFEKNSTSDEFLSEIRLPLSQGIVGHVARTGQLMNVSDVYNHPSFYPNVDERTGFVTRNVLCFPIKDSSGSLVGVAELCNKIGKPSFTRHDEQVMSTFAVYCAISISHCLLYRKLQEAHRRSQISSELLVQGSTFSISPEDILRLTVREIPSPESFHPNFNEFLFFPRLIGTGDIYVEAALSMFQELGLIERFRIRRRTLARFLLMVQKGYREVPYHNWGHAFAVAHFAYLLLRLPTVQDVLDELERLSLLVACLCHDIDHRGTTNSFQLQSKTPLAQLYSSEGSVLERHHFAQTVTILGMDECNIFDALTRHEYQTVLDNMREIILATDLVAHLRKVDRTQRMVNIGFKKESSEHHYLFICLLMTASDLSDQSKHFKHSKLIAENIYKEFFSQGDLERQMGNEPSEMFNRERACVPKIQLEFTDTVALKVFNCISKLLPELSVTYEMLKMNRACWEALDEIVLEEGIQTSSSLDYLRNEATEKKVYERVEAQGKFNQLLRREKTPSDDEKSK